MSPSCEGEAWKKVSFDIVTPSISNLCACNIWILFISTQIQPAPGGLFADNIFTVAINCKYASIWMAPLSMSSTSCLCVRVCVCVCTCDREIDALNNRMENVTCQRLQRAGCYFRNNDSIIVTGRTLTSLITKTIPLKTLKSKVMHCTLCN